MDFSKLLMTYAVPVWFMILFLVFFLIIIIASVWLFIVFIKKWTSDVLIFIDKNDRWQLIYDRIKGKNTYDYDGKKYHLKDEGGILNHRGKAMYHFTENKPEPMTITHGKANWLDAKSLEAVMKNDLVQKIVKPQNKSLEILYIIGAVGGMLAAISSIVMLLITTGVIKLTP